MAILTSSFAIGYYNHASGKTITATTSGTGYPASNLSSARLSSSWRSATGSLTSQNVDVDLGSSLSIDVIALIGTNLTDAANRTPKTAENSAFSSPEYNPGSANVFDTSYPVLLTNTHRYGRNLIVLPGSTLSSRYVRVTLNNSGHVDGHLSARVYWVGPLWQPLYSFAGREGTYKRRLETVGNPGVERSLSYLEVTFDALTEAEGVALQSLCTTRLRTGRLLVIPRPDQPATWQTEAFYCTLASLPTLSAWPQGGGLSYWKVGLVFKECED